MRQGRTEAVRGLADRCKQYLLLFVLFCFLPFLRTQTVRNTCFFAMFVHRCLYVVHAVILIGCGTYNLILIVLRWTDFSVLEKAAKNNKEPTHFIQGSISYLLFLFVLRVVYMHNTV